ncbi:MAG: SIR2 family protein [Abitibacteriaceae bacterium]|nr:SIR2 family protein [Abditibacteriaceae bacterium]
MHQTESTVATLNYDTVLERATGEHPELNHIFTSNLYRMPIAPLGQRTAAVFAGETRPTYRLLKLHGSVNWYFSGDENVEGQQVYEDWLPEFIGRGQKEEESQKNIQSHLEYEGLNKMDLRPLIIPPVADKSAFYKTRTVRLTWSEFRKSLKESSELYCIGYSLPKTDLTMRLFLRAAVEGNPKRVYIVNSATGDSARELKRSYQEVFAGCSIDEQYFGRQDAVKHMTDNLSQA